MDNERVSDAKRLKNVQRLVASAALAGVRFEQIKVYDPNNGYPYGPNARWKYTLPDGMWHVAISIESAARRALLMLQMDLP